MLKNVVFSCDGTAKSTLLGRADEVM